MNVQSYYSVNVSTALNNMLQFNKFVWFGIIIGQLVPQGCFSLSVVIIPNNFLTFHFLASTGY